MRKLHDLRILFILFSWMKNNASTAFHHPSCNYKLSIRRGRHRDKHWTESSYRNTPICCNKLFSNIQKDDRNQIINFEETENFGFPPDTVTKPLALLLFAQFLLFLGVGAIIPTIPLYGNEIGLSGAANGIVISAPAVMLVLLSKVAGSWADRLRKPSMMVGMALIGISDWATSIATTIPFLLLARLGLGAGRCIAEAGERGMLADLAQQVPQYRGRILSYQSVVYALGIAIGAPLGGIVVEQYGPRASFLCVTAAAFLTLGLYCFLPETLSLRETHTKHEASENFLVRDLLASFDTKTPESFTQEESGDWSILLSQREWQGLACCQCGATFGFAAKIASIPLLASDVLPGGAIGAGALVSATGLCGIAGAPLGGWLSDRMSPTFTILIGGMISATGLLLVPVALSWDTTNLDGSLLGGMVELSDVAFVAAVLLWSLGASAQAPALTAMAQKLAPDSAKSTAMALPRAIGDGTYLLAPGILGFVADATHGGDALPQGSECAVAGAAIGCGTLLLGLLTKNTKVT